MSSIKDLVENPHPIHKANKDFWQFLLESYEGGIDYCKAKVNSPSITGALTAWALKMFAGTTQLKTTSSGNLFIHPKERVEDYQDRIQMSYYYNFCGPIIDIYSDHLFKQPITEDFGSIEDDVERKRENIDNRGGSIGEFRKETADLAQIYGHIYVITDSPMYSGLVNSKADIIDNDLFPYFTHHHPQNIVNWALDEFGRPYWIVVKEDLDLNLDPLNFDKNRITSYRFRLWTRQEWILFDAEYNEIGRGTHGLGVVPITCIYDKQSKKVRNFLGISSLADIAFIARDVYNSCSELKQILRDQTFAFLAVQGNSGDYSEVVLATTKGLMYPPDRNVPQYVSPPTGNAEVYFRHIDRQVTKMFELAKIESGSVRAPDGQSAVEQSGVSKAWDFNQTNSALSKKAGNLEDGENKLWGVFARWLGVQEFDGSITYPNEFSIQSLNADLSEAEKIMRLSLGAEFNKEVKKAIMKKKFPRMGEEDMSKMIGEMETQEDNLVKGESGRLADRVPSLFNRFAKDANSADKGG